jgi:hypothetical protein
MSPVQALKQRWIGGINVVNTILTFVFNGPPARLGWGWGAPSNPPHQNSGRDPGPVLRMSELGRQEATQTVAVLIPDQKTDRPPLSPRMAKRLDAGEGEADHWAEGRGRRLRTKR